MPRCVVCSKIKPMSIAVCFDCFKVIACKDAERQVANRLERIRELQEKITNCDASGWPVDTKKACKIFFTTLWPNYTPKKDYEREIHNIQKWLKIPTTYPTYFNLCPLGTTHSGY